MFFPYQFRCYRFRPRSRCSRFDFFLNIFFFHFVSSPRRPLSRATTTHTRRRFALAVIGPCTRDKYKRCSAYDVVRGGITENYGRLSVGVCRATFRLRRIVYVPLKSKFYCIKRLERSNLYDFSARLEFRSSVKLFRNVPFQKTQSIVRFWHRHCFASHSVIAHGIEYVFRGLYDFSKLSTTTTTTVVYVQFITENVVDNETSTSCKNSIERFELKIAFL